MYVAWKRVDAECQQNQRFHCWYQDSSWSSTGDIAGWHVDIYCASRWLIHMCIWVFLALVYITLWSSLQVMLKKQAYHVAVSGNSFQDYRQVEIGQRLLHRFWFLLEPTLTDVFRDALAVLHQSLVGSLPMSSRLFRRRRSWGKCYVILIASGPSICLQRP